MSFNGSGTFNINSTGQPVVSGTVISSSVFNALTADLATGLSTCLTKDGQTTVTANIPMNSFKFTGLAAGTAATDSVRVGQLQAGGATLVTVAGTDTYTGTMSPSLAAYAAGNTFTFVVPNTNTTAATLNIDGLGAKALTRDGSTALVAGDLVANAEVAVVYDGTRFQVLNSNSKTNFNLSGTLTVAGNTTLSGGTANGVAYLNGSKVLTTGSALTFDGTTLTTTNVKLASSGSIVDGGGNATLTPTSGGSVALTSNGAYTNGNIVYNALAATGVHVFSVNSTEGMRLTSTGLGIGTSSPSAKLDVNGASNLGGNIQTINGATFYNSIGDLFIRAGTSGALKLGAGGTNSLAILDSSGNLGLGVTPSAWGSGVKVVQVSNYAAVSSSGAYGGSYSSNSYYDGTNWKYITTDSATKYDQVSGRHTWYNAASGTAGNTITFTQAMTLFASGSLGLGTSSDLLNQQGNLALNGASGSANGCVLGFAQGGSVIGGIGQYSRMAGFGTSQDIYIQSQGASNNVGINANPTGAFIYFQTQATERARIDSSGNLLVGTTSNVGSARVAVTFAGPSNDGVDILDSANGSGSQFMAFRNSAGTAIGSITRVTTTNAVSYNTTSDQRLKENITDANSASDLIDAIKVRQFDWIGDGTHQRYGMIAQELHEVAPEAVHAPGDPDAMMAVDYSKLVPMLVKEIQSLRVRLNALENK